MMIGTSDTQPQRTCAGKITQSLDIQYAAARLSPPQSDIDMLTQRLDAEAERAVQAERPLTILNVGCGPAVEVQRFIRNNPLADYADFTLMDFNDETLAHTELKIQEALRESGRRTTVRFIQKSIDDLLQEAYQNQEAQPASYELVYCAGLFDYFSDRICRRLVELFCRWVQPHGHIAVTNVHPSNPNRHQMEHLLEWYLVYRNEAAMRSLAPHGVVHEVEPDATGVNVFLDLYPGGRS